MQNSKEEYSNKMPATDSKEKMEQVHSDDIKNAHASGDGSIKRSDETIGEQSETKKGGTKTGTENY